MASLLAQRAAPAARRRRFLTDSLPGEAMGIAPIVLMADGILKAPARKKSWVARDAWLTSPAGF